MHHLVAISDPLSNYLVWKLSSGLKKPIIEKLGSVSVK